MHQQVKNYLSSITNGHLRICMSDGNTYSFGDPSDSKRVEVAVHNPGFMRALAITPEITLGESYVDGHWSIRDGRLADLFGIIWMNKDNRPSRGKLVASLLRLFASGVRSNRRDVARRAVQHHYDRRRELFELFLDPSLTYSCGYMRSHTDTLEQMQQQKFELILRKLAVGDRASVVDLGCGWGGLLLYIGRTRPTATVHGVTLSESQLSFVQESIEKERMGDRLRVSLQDFRDANGHNYDFLVSVGMFEHLGRADYAQFMAKARTLLKPGGRGLLHTMAVTEHPTTNPDPWLSKHIFPRHRAPRIEEVLGEMRRAGLQIGHVENLKPHYAETFRRWSDRFATAQQSVNTMFNDDGRFFRMWYYYLQLCEAGFRFGTMEIYQILFANQLWTHPPTFDFYSDPNPIAAAATTVTCDLLNRIEGVKDNV